jgi:hypothetical protein
MVSLLLAVLHPTSVRTDGAGGDGGRDVHVEGNGNDGDDIFELKSFTGRLNGSRRRQIKRSFQRAMASKPASWALVVPIDLNPAEQKWFREELTAGAAARCRWHGKTWLDACMAENPCVARYCLSNVTNELAALAVQLGAEKAALANGVPDAIERLRSLQALANEVDPFYYVDLATDGARGTVSASLRPRFPTAAQERPIVVEASLVFPDVETAQKTRDALKATYDFGTATAIPAEFVNKVVVNAPAGLGGLGGEFSGGDLVISQRLRDMAVFKLRLMVTGPDGALLASLPLEGKTDNVGARGLMATMSDGSGWLRAGFRLDFEQKSFHIDLAVTPRPCMPSQLLPLVRTLDQLKAPNLATVCLEDGTPVAPATPQTNPEAMTQDYLGVLVGLLVKLQDKTANWFELPESLTQEEYQDLLLAEKLLDGEVVDGTWSEWRSVVTAADASNMLNGLASDYGGLDASVTLWKNGPLAVGVAGKQLAIGQVTVVLRSACLRDPGATEARVHEAGPGGDVELCFIPANSDAFEQWLGKPEDYPRQKAGDATT